MLGKLKTSLNLMFLRILEIQVNSGSFLLNQEELF